MERESVRIFAPATVANVGCAFDVLGFAVSAPGDIVSAKRSSTPGVHIEKIEGDNGKLPREAAQNTAGVAAMHALSLLGIKNRGISMILSKQMPLGSGLGSSAASAVAGAVAVNALFGNRLSPAQLVQCAMEGERVACGAAHADNVAPSLLGGFVLIRSYEPLDLVKLPTPPSLYCVIAHPHLELLTEDARKILRKQVPFSIAIKQFANVGGLVAGIYTQDSDLMGRSLQDLIVEPERSSLIPGFYAIKQAAIDAGATGCAISGSGPSLFAFVKSDSLTTAVGAAMTEAFKREGVGCDIFSSLVSDSGARVIEEQ